MFIKALLLQKIFLCSHGPISVKSEGEVKAWVGHLNSDKNFCEIPHPRTSATGQMMSFSL